MTGENRPPYLFVKHSEGWNVDRCTRWMEQADLPVEFCYPTSGQAFPDPATYSGVMVFGGRWVVSDAHAEPWILEEQRFIERCLHVNTPYFGICLGAQMLAHVLGGAVSRHPDDIREVGFHRVVPTENGRMFLPQPLSVMQWHSEGFDLPHGATCLATSPEGDASAFPNQAFSLDRQTVGVQFHPEVNPEVLAIWHERNRQRKPDDLSDAERAIQTDDAQRFDADISAWLGAFLADWTNQAKSAV